MLAAAVAVLPAGRQPAARTSGAAVAAGGRPIGKIRNRRGDGVRGGLRHRRDSARFAVTCTFADPGAAGGGGLGESFPRIKERDPYKRLGVSREATSEEISEVE